MARITVGFDFGTHQTKICYETVEAGTTFCDVFRFKKPDGEEAVTLPSFIRLGADGRLRYGYEAMIKDQDWPAITYFKQRMFSWSGDAGDRAEAEGWSVLYLAYVIFNLDARFPGSPPYIVQMGMPTDADPRHYAFCKHQAIKVMASAMQLVRGVFNNDLTAYLNTPATELADLARQCLNSVSRDDREARAKFPILVFPEAYAALIPLINDNKLPTVGPNLFVDIGGGTVDISLFTNQMDGTSGRRCPYLYYYYSVPYGLNMITGQDLRSTHNVEVGFEQLATQNINGFREKMLCAIDDIMKILRLKYVETGKTSVMPFENLCGQILHGRPVCYSGGGSMFLGLRPPLANSGGGVSYNFSHVTTVSELINHSKLYVDDRMFHVLATAFALSHHTLIDGTAQGEEPDSIKLVAIDRLFAGVCLPSVSPLPKGANWERKKNWNW